MGLTIEGNQEKCKVCFTERWEQSLDPLIHTELDLNLPQDVEQKKAAPVIPHLLSLNQKIAAWSQGRSVY
jgi:hypothetical protein